MPTNTKKYTESHISWGRSVPTNYREYWKYVNLVTGKETYYKRKRYNEAANQARALERASVRVNKEKSRMKSFEIKPTFIIKI